MTDNIPDLDKNDDGKITHEDMKDRNVNATVKEALIASGIGVGDLNYQEARINAGREDAVEKYNTELSDSLAKYSERMTPFMEKEMKESGKSLEELYKQSNMEYDIAGADMVTLHSNLQAMEVDESAKVLPANTPNAKPASEEREL